MSSAVPLTSNSTFDVNALSTIPSDTSATPVTSTLETPPFSITPVPALITEATSSVISN